MRDIKNFISESLITKGWQVNAFQALKKIYNKKPELSEDGKYIFVKIETRRTYQYISIYEEDKDHVMIYTGMYEDAYVVPNTKEDIEKFLKAYENDTISDNAIEVQKYRKSK